MVQKNKINKKIHIVSDEENTADKGDYKNFMSKGYQQPITVKKCVSEYIDSLKKILTSTIFQLNQTISKK